MRMNFFSMKIPDYWRTKVNLFLFKLRNGFDRILNILLCEMVLKQSCLNSEMILAESSETFFGAKNCPTRQRGRMPTSGKLNLKGPIYNRKKLFYTCNLQLFK